MASTATTGDWFKSLNADMRRVATTTHQVVSGDKKARKATSQPAAKKAKEPRVEVATGTDLPPRVLNAELKRLLKDGELTADSVLASGESAGQYLTRLWISQKEAKNKAAEGVCAAAAEGSSEDARLNQ